MLEATGPLMTESEIMQENSPRETINWAIGVVRRQFAVIALIAVVGTSLGALYAFMAPPTYTAESTIAIDPRRVQLFPNATFSEGKIDSPALESEIELVKSEPVALSVIENLGLAKDPEFLRPQGIFGVLRGFASHFFSSSKPTVLSESEATRAALEVLSKNLTVNRVGFSYYLSLQYRSGNPNRAAQIANAIAAAYIAEQLEGKYDSTRRATQWLQGRLAELNQKQALAERAVLDFKKQNNVITADGKLVNEQLIAELNSQLAVAHKRISEAKARLERIDAVIRDDSSDTKTGPTVADTLNNPIIQQLRAKYLDLVNREENYARKYGANHLAVVNLRDQIRDLRGSILEEMRRLRESYLSNYEIAKQEEQELEKRLAEVVSRSQPINQAQVPLRELESSAQNYRTTYDNFRQRYTESLQQQSFPISDARILTSASPPSSKSSPKSALVLVLGVAGGLAFGVAVGVFRELMNGSFCTKAQVESALQTACISVVPIAENGQRQTLRNARLAAPDQGLGDGSSSRAISRDQDLIWSALDSPFSRFAEALRSIKVAIDQNSGAASSSRKAVSKDGKPLYGAAKASSIAKREREREACAIVGFTSSLPNEGKSTIAASLAVLMAQAGARVILVDCDLRNPSLSRKLAPKAEHGVLDVIAGRVPLEDAVWKEVSTNLTFLPVATKTRIEQSSEILAAAGTEGLFEDLQSNHDYVIVDLSPLVPVVDTRATTRFVDWYVCVIAWGCTTIGAVKYAFQDAPNVYENLLGVVLNKANIDRLSTYEPVGRNYYRNKYYAQYGMTE
jgi:succinoglycan biosynthesis transport protein ExoP